MTGSDRFGVGEGRAVFLDAARGADGSGWGFDAAFGAPNAIRRAWTHAETPGVVDWAEAESRAGRWVVLVLAFEAAPAFDAAFAVHAPADGLPLAWAASHETRLPGFRLPGPAAPPRLPWRALTPPDDYARRFDLLQELIAAGETYQANYTVPFELAWAGGRADPDGLAWFARLAGAQPAGFCAWLDMGRHKVLSISPELFFRLDAADAAGAGRGLLARPMKGTAPRGSDAASDGALRRGLAASLKNRAENVMIVDLLRNDLGRVARTGSVRVPRLFHVEAYPSLFQMTSDVRASLRPGLGLRDALTAMFPCGSVTGAPKVRTMEIIRDLEPLPRGVYCGTVGLLAPGSGGLPGRAVFSVPIRTVTMDVAAGVARFGVGGGVTHCSEMADEYRECLTKMRFLTPPEEDFRLIESLLLLDGRFPLLAGHLERLSRSAASLGFPLDAAAARRALAELTAAHPRGRFKARLLLSRDGELTAEASAISGGRARPLLLGFASRPVVADDPWLAYKTTRREVYEAALAACPGCGDALLVNTRGEVTESTRANLLLWLDGELVTPPLSCGLLPGVFRAGLLHRGVARERVVRPADVLRAGRVWLVNAVRWWMPCRMS